MSYLNFFIFVTVFTIIELTKSHNLVLLGSVTNKGIGLKVVTCLNGSF